MTSLQKAIPDINFKAVMDGIAVQSRKTRPGNRSAILNSNILSTYIFRLGIVAACCFNLTIGKCCGQNPDSRSILNKVFEKIAGINTAAYRICYQERVYESGKIRRDSSNIKYQKFPQRVYMKLANGTELLWGPGLNDGDVLVHPSSFPYFTMSLNPNGYWMRKNQHHGIDELGFDYFSELLKAAMGRAGSDFDRHFFYKGELTFDGCSCIEIEMLDPGFRFALYTVKQGETILSIARSQSLNGYMVLKHNPGVSSYTDIKAGQAILLPSNYAAQVTIYINKKTMLPIMLRVDDEKGLFEEYVYKELQINPDFNSEEFSKDNKEYHF
jgi:hypothetical protein